jgi:hypothetical protein
MSGSTIRQVLVIAAGILVAVVAMSIVGRVAR